MAARRLDDPFIRYLIDEHIRRTLPRLQRLWMYYRNPLESGRLGQEAGLPARLTGRADPGADDRDTPREIVIENEIGWRIQTMVDFMFGKPVSIVSTARDPHTRARIERALDEVWEASGGIALLQDMALLGHVYGHVDLVLRVRGDGPRVEVVEPTRAIPVLDPDDYRRLHACVIHFERPLNRVEPGFWRDILRRPSRAAESTVTEVLTSTHSRLYEDGRLVSTVAHPWAGSEPPVVHIQNISQPLRYEGMSEVEPLIPLQDELNTRLSDRASRVTLQSFKMYLARGLDGFDRARVGPGQIWSTDNPHASIESFGGDADTPDEARHIDEVREALDKISGVPPLASGVVRAKIGNLTSANALRITLMGLLSKTARKRVTYGRAIARMSALVLAALHDTGALRTDPAERAVRLSWRDPLPEDMGETMAAARAKVDLGVPVERVLAELGYAPADAGVV